MRAEDIISNVNVELPKKIFIIYLVNREEDLNK